MFLKIYSQALGINDKNILNLGSDYPSPIVIHENARSKALNAFKKI